MIILSPSLLACDFANLESEIKKVYDSGCRYLHLDVMDGVFVNNISFGLPVISSIRKICDIVFDVHLMITEPARYIREFAEAGADIINFHVEACTSDEEIFDTLNLIKQQGKKCALTVKPDTPAEALEPFLGELDMVLVMSVEPGFGGQKFIEGSLEKIKYLAELKRLKNYSFDIEIDGGVNADNITRVKEAGANIIVAGSGIFGACDIKSAVEIFTAQT
ncbi:MAG: ribulose-phosphate 3-epimerase [Oscillospiraceae bacterium]|nr:ribulose-phosphate 3-epimerase [Oscillospiraceae bacterium]